MSTDKNKKKCERIVKLNKEKEKQEVFSLLPIFKK